MSTVASMPTPIARHLHAGASIGLDELQRTAALRTRVDRKYIVDWATLGHLLDAISSTHRPLEIDGTRVFRYESVYFDSADLAAFRAHMQQRRRRFKVRTRLYVDSGLQTFEVKLKGRRGETVKHQLPYAGQDRATIAEPAREFLTARLAEAYPQLEVPDLMPVLTNRYRRVTLAAGGERLTCDFDLSYADAAGEVPGLDAGFVILESKCERGTGSVDRELRRLGIAPVACSKYCVGIGLLRADVRVNDLRWLLRRYFTGHDRGPGHPLELRQAARV